jgi:hypothetical protein
MRVDLLTVLYVEQFVKLYNCDRTSAVLPSTIIGRGNECRVVVVEKRALFLVDNRAKESSPSRLFGLYASCD